MLYDALEALMPLLCDMSMLWHSSSLPESPSSYHFGARVAPGNLTDHWFITVMIVYSFYSSFLGSQAEVLPFSFPSEMPKAATTHIRKTM